MIFQHHEQHGGQWDIALDVGAGGGTITKVLLQKFHHVILSDPSDEYVTRAQARFRKEADAGTVTFARRKFHEFKPQEDFPAGKQVDLITAGTQVHVQKGISFIRLSDIECLTNRDILYAYETRPHVSHFDVLLRDIY